MNNKSLKEDFHKRSLWINNRASCYFPYYLNTNLDTIICFQNYWKWKNNIDNILVNLRIRDESGNLLFTNQLLPKKHNEISILKIFNENKIKGSISGLCEIEVLSPENLGYPFPAVTAFYKCGDNISSVHAAGRVFNSNESWQNASFSETNFLCLLSKELTPFFNIFNGQQAFKNKFLEIKILNFYDNKSLLKKKIKLSLESFGSRTLYLNNLLSKKENEVLKNNDFYVCIESEIAGIFPRLIAGNYHYKTNMHYVTHTFQNLGLQNEDYVKPNDSDPISTFLPIFNQSPLKVKVRSYPTNQKSILTTNKKSTIINNSLGQKVESTRKINTSQNGFEIELEDNLFEKYEVFKNAPARINASYNFYLPNSLHPTDIATGFKANVYPNKSTHWGIYPNKKDWLTRLFIRNASHNPEITSKSTIKLKIFDNDQMISRLISVKPESVKTYDIEYIESKNEFLSWHAKSEEGLIEIFWISFNKKTGSICGDHSY